MIELPEGVVPNNMIPALIDRGGYQGEVVLLRVDRPGNRYRIAVSLPPIENEGLGRVAVSRLLQGKTEGMRIEYQLCGVDQGSPGLPRVDGGDQSGRNLMIKGCRLGYAVSEGFWLSIETDGQHYLYNVAEPAATNETGKMTLKLTPPLRKQPADNDVVHLARPMIEGAVRGEEASWEMSLAHHVGIQFEIEEVR
ncbi:MAG: hypothetical protein WA940_09225 [Sphingopyxis sp.]